MEDLNHLDLLYFSYKDINNKLDKLNEDINDFKKHIKSSNKTKKTDLMHELAELNRGRDEIKEASKEFRKKIVEKIYSLKTKNINSHLKAEFNYLKGYSRTEHDLNRIIFISLYLRYLKLTKDIVNNNSPDKKQQLFEIINKINKFIDKPELTHANFNESNQENMNNFETALDPVLEQYYETPAQVKGGSRKVSYHRKHKSTRNSKIDIKGSTRRVRK
jgi:hypothetical protein